MNLTSQQNMYGIPKKLISKILFSAILISSLCIYTQLTSKNTTEIPPIIYPEIDVWKVIPPQLEIIRSQHFLDEHLIKGSVDLDSDHDGLTDEEEERYNTDPNNPDSDYDGLLDGEEVYLYRTFPNKPDSDNDYIVDSWEVFKFKTDPMKADTDFDGLNDGLEIWKFFSNPFDPDTDGDLLCDFDEGRIYKTDIRNCDSDFDGIFDGMEVHVYKTNPLSADTDGDDLLDAWEIENNYDPTRKDNWDRIIGMYILIPGVGVTLAILGLFASINAKLVRPSRFKTIFEQKQEQEQSKLQLIELLTSVPDDQQLDINELSTLTGESVDVICQLLASAFDLNDDNDENLTFNPEKVTITSHNGKTYFEYTCFYCKEPIEDLIDFCTHCDEVIVRCKICNSPISYDDSYATYASYEIAGNPENLYGIVALELICESCIVSKRYNYI